MGFGMGGGEGGLRLSCEYAKELRVAALPTELGKSLANLKLANLKFKSRTTYRGAI